MSKNQAPFLINIAIIYYSSMTIAYILSYDTPAHDALLGTILLLLAGMAGFGVCLSLNISAGYRIFFKAVTVFYVIILQLIFLISADGIRPFERWEKVIANVIPLLFNIANALIGISQWRKNA